MCTVALNLTSAYLTVYPITVAVTSHTHGHITFDGCFDSSTDTSVTSDYLLFADASDNLKIEK
jgi:hypothetical protein